MKKNYLKLFVIFSSILTFSCSDEGFYDETKNKENKISRLEDNYNIEYKGEYISDSSALIIEFKSIEEFEKYKQDIKYGIEIYSLDNTKLTKEYSAGEYFIINQNYSTIINSTNVNFHLLFSGNVGVSSDINIQIDHAYGGIGFPSPWYSVSNFKSAYTLIYCCKSIIVYKILGIGLFQEQIKLSGYLYLNTYNSNAQLMIGEDKITIIHNN